MSSKYVLIPSQRLRKIYCVSTKRVSNVSQLFSAHMYHKTTHTHVTSADPMRCKMSFPCHKRPQCTPQECVGVAHLHCIETGYKRRLTDGRSYLLQVEAKRSANQQNKILGPSSKCKLSPLIILVDTVDTFIISKKQ